VRGEGALRYREGAETESLGYVRFLSAVGELTLTMLVMFQDQEGHHASPTGRGTFGSSLIVWPHRLYRFEVMQSLTRGGEGRAERGWGP